MRCRQRHDEDVRSARGGSIGGGVLSRIGVLTVTVACALALLVAPATQAATVTVGSVLPPGSAATEFGQVQTLFNTSLPEKGANLVSPVNGAIVRWRIQDAEGGPFYLRVLRPNGSGGYTAIGTSNPATPSGPGLQTFTANMSIQAGDLIGIDPTNGTDKVGVAEAAGASYGFVFPPPFDNSTVAASGTVAGKEVLVSAEVQPAPSIAALEPNLGPVAGGTSVKITGADFTAASAVKFGDVPATAFTVESDTQITATAPRSKIVGGVDITVTTLAGTSATTRADRFFYEGCVVPKLAGKKLRTAKRMIGRAQCKLGKVTRRTTKKASRRGKVIAQSPKPRKLLATGAKVNITLGK